jgi:uncharacterized protein YkwD
MPRLPLIATIAVVGALLAPAVATAACHHTHTLPRHTADVKRARTAVLCLVNKERTKRHLHALSRNSTLRAVGSDLAKDMVKRQYFDHTTPDGKDFGDRLRSHHWKGSSAGENIAWGSGSLGTPASIVKGWMHSPGHRANILHKSFRRAGVGIAPGAPEDGVGAAATYAMDYDNP